MSAARKSHRCSGTCPAYESGRGLRALQDACAPSSSHRGAIPLYARPVSVIQNRCHARLTGWKPVSLSTGLRSFLTGPGGPSRHGSDLVIHTILTSRSAPHSMLPPACAPSGPQGIWRKLRVASSRVPCTRTPPCRQSRPSSRRCASPARGPGRRG